MGERQPYLLLGGGSFFEAPRWHDGRWWVSDFYRHRVIAVRPDGHDEEIMAVRHQPSGLGWPPDGSLLVVSMRDQQILRRSSEGAVSVHADLAGTCEGNLNDMVVDPKGRAWVGNLGFDVEISRPRPTDLIRVDPDGSAAVCAEDLRMPNGSVIRC